MCQRVDDVCGETRRVKTDGCLHRPTAPGAITNLYPRLTTLYASDPAQAIEFVSTPEARSRIWGELPSPWVRPRGLVTPAHAGMPSDPNNASPSSRAKEGPGRNLLLLISCIVGLLVGLGVFGFVCYLLMH